MAEERDRVDLTSRAWGPWIEGRIRQTQDVMEVVEPYRGETVARVGVAAEEHVAEAVAAASSATQAARAVPVHERAAILRRAADIAGVAAEELARVVTSETGKPLKDTRREAGRVPWVLRAAATAVEAMRGDLYTADAMPGGEGLTAFSMRRPVGVVAAITPFNAPLNLVAHKLAPAVAAGNTLVVKPASAAPLPALRLAEILTEAGLPDGFVNVLPGGPPVARRLIADPRVRLITFTGGQSTGESILKSAGVRRVLLELGGNSPNLVHRDADLALATSEILRGGFANNGQSCNSVQRIYVHREVFEAFSGRLVDAVGGLRTGDPLDPETDVGPLVNEASAVRVAEWIDEARDQGASIPTGGERRGALLRPTVVVGAPESCRLSVEEVFAPLVLLYPYDDLGAAIARANDTNYGLQAAIFTDSLEVALRAGREMESGAVLVNRSSNFRLDHLPYGGVKQSGLGREGPEAAILEMTELKVVVFGPSRAASSR